MAIMGNGGKIIGTGGTVGAPCCCQQCPTDCTTCPNTYTASITYGGGAPCDQIDAGTTVIATRTDPTSCGWSGEVGYMNPSFDVYCLDGVWHADLYICWDIPQYSDYVFYGRWESTCGPGGPGTCPQVSSPTVTLSELIWHRFSDGVDGTCTWSVSIA